VVIENPNANEAKAEQLKNKLVKFNPEKIPRKFGRLTTNDTTIQINISADRNILFFWAKILSEKILRLQQS